MTKYIFVGLGIGIAGFLVVLLVAIIFAPSKNSNIAKNPILVNNPSVLGMEQNVEEKEVPTATPIPPTPTPTIATTFKFGEKATLKEGRSITVNKPEAGYQPDNYMGLPTGKQYVTVEAIYENNGSQKIACDPYTAFSLTDKQGNYYQSDISRVKKPSLDCPESIKDNAYIQPNSSVKGYVTFVVDKNTEVDKVVYKNYQFQEEIEFKPE